MTVNHGYDTPPHGTLDWHTFLNQNFEKLDTDVPIVDLDSNRTLYEPTQGAVFFASDAPKLYVGDGSSFILRWDASAESVAPTGQIAPTGPWTMSGEATLAVQGLGRHFRTNKVPIRAGETYSVERIMLIAPSGTTEVTMELRVGAPSQPLEIINSNGLGTEPLILDDVLTGTVDTDTFLDVLVFNRSPEEQVVSYSAKVDTF